MLPIGVSAQNYSRGRKHGLYKKHCYTQVFWHYGKKVKRVICVDRHGHRRRDYRDYRDYRDNRDDRNYRNRSYHRDGNGKSTVKFGIRINR